MTKKINNSGLLIVHKSGYLGGELFEADEQLLPNEVKQEKSTETERETVVNDLSEWSDNSLPPIEINAGTRFEDTTTFASDSDNVLLPMQF